MKCRTLSNLRAIMRLEGLANWKIQWPNRDSNPRPSSLSHIASTITLPRVPIAVVCRSRGNICDTSVYHIYTCRTERAGWIRQASDLYSREVQFESRPGHRISWGFALIFWDGVRLNLFGMSASICPIVQTPDDDDDDDDVWCSRWNENWQGKPKYSEKTCPNTTLSTTNPTWPHLGSNPGHRDGKPATDRLSSCTALKGFVGLSLHTDAGIVPEVILRPVPSISLPIQHSQIICTRRCIVWDADSVVK
jgi:hypothetical protein